MDYPLLPNGTTIVTNIGITGAGTVHEALDDPFGTNDGDTTRVARGGTTLNGEFQLTKDALPSVASIQNVRLRYAAKETDPGGVPALVKPYLYIEGVRYYGATVDPNDGSFAEYFDDFPENPATNTPWTKGALDDAEMGAELPRDDPDFTSIQHLTYMNILVSAIPADPGDGREIGTAYERIIRRPVEFVHIDVGPEILDTTLMEDMSLSHLAHPLTQILGQFDWRGILKTGKEGWQRILMQLRAIDLDLNTLQADVTLRRRRGELVSFYDGAESRVSGASIEDGVARLTTGGVITYERDSRAWGEDPASGLIIPYETNERTIFEDGYTAENFATNWLPSSSFIGGNGMTDVSGSGSGAMETPAEDAIFRDDVTQHCWVMTAGNPHTTENISAADDSNTVPAGTVLRLSVDHKDDSGAVLDWQLIRASDGWNWTGATWATPARGSGDWNSFPVRTSPGRDKSTRITATGVDDTFTLRFRQASGGTVLRENRIYHVQLESNGFGIMTSRIVTNGAAYAREVPMYHVEDIVGKRAFTLQYGTFFAEIIPSWDSADMDIGSNFPTIFVIQYDTDNEYRLFYNGPAGERLDFIAEVGGATTSASAPYTAVAGEMSRIAVRYLPINEGDIFGLEQGTMSVFVNGVKGTDAVRSGNPAGLLADAFLEIGTDVLTGSGAAWNGVIRRILFTPEYLTDDEIAAFTW